MKRLNFLILAVFAASVAFGAGQVDTVMIYASKMKKEVKTICVLPRDYTQSKRYPVVYLLHGYSDNSTKWVKTVPGIKDLSTQYQCIIVCPDGGYSSWYFDSPVDSAFQYESYITKDAIRYIDSHYATIADRRARAITGLSMGGHGALYLAIRNRNLFASAGSMSGGVDLLSSTKSFDIAKRIGKYENSSEEWHKRSVINMVDSLKNNDLNLIIDCGVSDFFYQINSNLHKKLLTLKIDHDYIERPGSHNWRYWENAIKYQMLYFNECFNRLQKPSERK